MIPVNNVLWETCRLHVETITYRDVAGKKPKFKMGDGAPEITKAGNEVSEDCGIRTRLGRFGVTAMLSWGWLKLRLIEVAVDWS